MIVFSLLHIYHYLNIKTVALQQPPFLSFHFVCLQSVISGRINLHPVELEGYLTSAAEESPLIGLLCRIAQPATQTEPLLVLPAHLARPALSHLHTVSTDVNSSVQLLALLLAGPHTLSRSPPGTISAPLSSSPSRPRCPGPGRGRGSDKSPTETTCPAPCCCSAALSRTCIIVCRQRGEGVVTRLASLRQEYCLLGQRSPKDYNSNSRNYGICKKEEYMWTVFIVYKHLNNERLIISQVKRTQTVIDA